MQKIPIKEVAKICTDIALLHFGVKITRSRARKVIDIKFIIYLMLRQKGYNLNEIGGVFKYNHATIIHALKEGQNRLEFEEDFRDKYFKFKQILNEVLITYVGGYSIKIREKYLEKTNKMPILEGCYTAEYSAYLEQEMEKILNDEKI